MKTHHICPKCGASRILRVGDVAHGPTPKEAEDRPAAEFEAYVCDQCRYTELYAAAPINLEDDQVELVGDEEASFYDDWSTPPPISNADREWFTDEFDSTEVSRVAKKPGSDQGAMVVLMDIGQRPKDVLGILNGTLGLTIPDERWLRGALPYTVLDLISLDAADGLKKLLEDAGATAEVTSREEK